MKWINVNDTLPPEFSRNFCIDDNGYMYDSWFTEGKFKYVMACACLHKIKPVHKNTNFCTSEPMEISNVVFWMELPEPPNEMD